MESGRITIMSQGIKDPLRNISLPQNDIHIWSSALNSCPSEITDLKKTLSVDELIRADKYFFNHHRDHFIVGRGLLRHLLANYLQITPSEVKFVYDEYGKPSIGNLQTNDKLNFNVSHSSDHILYAISRNRNIGIDLEYNRDDFPVDEVSKRFLSPPELEMLSASPALSKTTLFYQLWTRKEAYSKGIGKGLSIPFNKFDVSQTPGDPVTELINNHLSFSTTRWYVKDIMINPDYAAAIATTLE